MIKNKNKKTPITANFRLKYNKINVLLIDPGHILDICDKSCYCSCFIVIKLELIHI